MKSFTLRCLFVAAAATVLFPSTFTCSAAKVVYDLNADWSDSQNPNGVWSYNQGTAPISIYQTFWWGQPGWGYLWIGDGCILKGSAPTGMDPWGNPVPPPHDWQPGDVMLHALALPYGGETTFVNIAWTSPADGKIDIAGTAWDGAIFEDREMSWQLIVAGKVIAQRSSVRGLYRSDAGASFANNLVGRNQLTGIAVNQGDVVEFRVIANTYYGHFIGVNETVTLNTRQNARPH